ncbi:cyanophycin synthetase [Clostridium rectalis]|uniref:cyanophycin synthetase n=1 Tax=Clostridium rectalis TaxID=2040295 RepID=UPI000F62EBF4|nr:cyanophycin synthetase [Clostridium rectalis]
MKILDFRYFHGRNIYSHKPCMRMDVNLEGFSERPSNSINNFNDNLINLVPELMKHRCGIDEEHGFVKRLKEGTYLAHICEHIIIALQNMIKIDVSYGKARELSGENYYIIYECKYKNVGIEVGKTAVNIINSLINNEKFNMNQAMEKIKEQLIKEEFGPSTLSIIKESETRGIPVIRVGDGSIVQLGYGSTSRMIEATIGENTSGIGIDLACDKLLTKDILYNQCIPVAEGGEVLSLSHAISTAEEIGYPVVLKPMNGNQGKCVFINLRNREEIEHAYELIVKKYNKILLEKYMVGRDYRVCVVDYKVVAVSERIPPYVIGDGFSNILQLIIKLNSDSRRGEGHEKPLTKIKIDDGLISYIYKNSYSINSVPKKGEKILLRENANLSTGGIAIDCTDLICEENIKICERTAKALGLDICGIDICCSDISKIIDGGIIEVNAAPGIRMHEFPYSGKNRNVGKAIFDMMFKNNLKQIPIVSVTGTNGKTTTTRLISYTLSVAGYKTGMTTTGGIYIDDECIEYGDTTGYDSAMTILRNREVEAAVLETARGGMIRKGLAYDLADVGIITNITSDHLGVDGIDHIEELAFVKSLVIESVKNDGYAVLNADDEASMQIIDRVKSKLILFSKEKNKEVLRENIKKGGISVYTYEGYIYVENSEGAYPIIKIKDIKITLSGKLEYNIENAMAACAALVALNIKYSTIRKGMKNFYLDEEHNPGRFNMYNVNGATIILDYGHNVEGYKAVLDGVKKLKHKRLVGIVGVPGDRQNSSMEQIGKISGESFDYIYIKEDLDKRGREEGEVANILKDGVLESGFTEDNIKVILDEKEALKVAINNSKKGDLIIIFFEKYEPLLKIVKEEINRYTRTKEALA